MAILDKLKSYIQDLDDKTFYQYSAIVLGSIILIVSVIWYASYRKISFLKKRIVTVNKNRQKLQETLYTYEKVKQQQAHVATLLEKDRNFKIVGFMDNLLSQLNLTSHKINYHQSEEVKVSLPEYTEIKLVVTLQGLNMKQLVDLLHQIENNERIYIKDLDITKSTSRPAIDVVFTVGTLQARAQEGTE